MPDPDNDTHHPVSCIALLSLQLSPQTTIYLRNRQPASCVSEIVSARCDTPVEKSHTLVYLREHKMYDISVMDRNTAQSIESTVFVVTEGR